MLIHKLDFLQIAFLLINAIRIVSDYIHCHSYVYQQIWNSLRFHALECLIFFINFLASVAFPNWLRCVRFLPLYASQSRGTYLMSLDFPISNTRDFWQYQILLHFFQFWQFNQSLKVIEWAQLQWHCTRVKYRMVRIIHPRFYMGPDLFYNASLLNWGIGQTLWPYQHRCSKNKEGFSPHLKKV